jgi:ribosomal protein S14
MKTLIQKDIKLRNKFSNQELNQKVLIYIFRKLLNNKKYSKKKKKIIFTILFKKYKNITSKTKIVRRCVLTGRSVSSTRVSGISRIKLQELIKNKEIRNCIKKSW